MISEHHHLSYSLILFYIILLLQITLLCQLQMLRDQTQYHRYRNTNQFCFHKPLRWSNNQLMMLLMSSILSKWDWWVGTNSFPAYGIPMPMYVPVFFLKPFVLLYKLALQVNFVLRNPLALIIVMWLLCQMTRAWC